MGTRRIGLILAGGAALWAAALAGAVLIAGPSGPGGFLSAVAAAVYATAGLLCHQRPERSFFIAGVQFPVCARCAGLYLGAAVVAVLTSARSPNVFGSLTTRRARTVAALAAAPTAITLLYEWTAGVMPHDWIRASAGVLLGGALAWILVASTEPEALAIH